MSNIRFAGTCMWRPLLPVTLRDQTQTDNAGSCRLGGFFKGSSSVGPSFLQPDGTLGI